MAIFLIGMTETLSHRGNFYCPKLIRFSALTALIERRSLKDSIAFNCVCSFHLSLGNEKRPPSLVICEEIREQFSGFGLSGGGRSHLRTRLRVKIPVNREKYREFCSSERLNRVYPLVKTGVNGFRPEIGTGNEQGNNRRHNREKASRNRNSITTQPCDSHFHRLISNLLCWVGAEFLLRHVPYSRFANHTGVMARRLEYND